MPVEVIMPKVEMDMATGTIAAWHVDEGQVIEKGEPLFDIETDKATMEVESPASGILHFISAKSGDIVEIGKCIGWLFEEGEIVENPGIDASCDDQAEASFDERPEVDLVEKTSAHRPRGEESTAPIRATPLARRIARSKGIDLSIISGTGPRGRITRSDVENYQPVLQVSSSSNTPVSGSVSLKSQLDDLGVEYETVPTDRMRQTIASRLTASKSSVPHFYLEMDCKLDPLLEFRQLINASLHEIGGPKVSINDMLVRACAQALKTVPEANASWAGDEIIRYKDANISVAVSIEGGLITPVVRQAQCKSLNRIAEEIADLADRARSGKLKTHEYQGGSFSISNLGMFGVKSFGAIINPPESMILAVGKAERRFIEDDEGKPVGATMLSVTLSCDHRVVDGALGAKWLSEFKRFVESPVLLSMDLE